MQGVGFHVMSYMATSNFDDHILLVHECLLDSTDQFGFMSLFE